MHAKRNIFLLLVVVILCGACTTVKPSRQHVEKQYGTEIVETRDGKQVISHSRGFSIILPFDCTGVSYNRRSLLTILVAHLPDTHLDDRSTIISWIEVWIEDRIANCHPRILVNPAIPLKVEQVSLSGNSYTKVYTPDLDYYSRQYVEYMTYGTNYCVHFSIDLSILGERTNMLPYMQEKLDRIISTFRWVKP